jgi:MFS transporter, putative metabolite:H+ symporter
MFVIVAVGATVVWFLRRAMPESPRWLAARGRLAEAKVIVRQAESESPIHEDAMPRVVTPASRPLGFADLFGHVLLNRTSLSPSLHAGE